MTDKKSYHKGFIDGLRCFAWWNNGISFVGTCGTMLKDAEAKAESMWSYDPEKEEEQQNDIRN